MTTTFTTAKNLAKIGTGDENNNWGVVLNDNFDLIDAALAGQLSKSVAGSSDVTLTSDEAANLMHTYSGVLTGNINVIVPAKTSPYLIYNNTSGAYTVTFKTPAGTGIVVPQGDRRQLICDATNVVNAAPAIIAALLGLSSNGLLARTAANTLAARTITGTANEVAVANGDAVSGNPTISLPSAINLNGKAIEGGVFTDMDQPLGPADGGLGEGFALANGDVGKGLKVNASNDGFELDPDLLHSNAAKTLTAGFSATPYNAGTKSTGSFTPDPANGNKQYYTNGGAHTLAPPSNPTSIEIEVTNNGSAGAITTSGFTKVDGPTPGTTNGHKFIAYVSKTQNYSLLIWQALQ